MKQPPPVMNIVKSLIYPLVPWLYLYLIELPLYKWYWAIGLHTIGILAYFAPLIMYVIFAILGLLIGIITYPIYRGILKAIKKNGFTLANWNFALNIGIVIFLIVTNRIALGFKSSAVLNNAPWLYVIIGLLISYTITGAIFYRTIKKAGQPVSAPFSFKILIMFGILSLLISIAYNSPRVLSAERNLKNNPNVLMITIDTANINYMPGYGSPDLVAPRLAEFLRKSIVFENAYCSVPLTTPSHASIFTGAHPQNHKAYTNESRLGYNVKLAQEFFKERGYITAGFPSSFNLSSVNNFDQGFDYYADRQTSDDFRTVILRHMAPYRFFELVLGTKVPDPAFPDNANAELTNKRFLKWINKNSDRRWYAWVHYFDLHMPYLPETAAKIPRAQQLGDFEKALEPSSVKALSCLYGSKYFEEKGIPPTELSAEDISYIRNLYREELKQVDKAFGDLLDNLKEKGLLDNTIIVIVGDHGEGLYERGYWGHNFFLNDDEIRIPLAVYLPESVWKQQEPEKLAYLVADNYLPAVDSLDQRVLKKELRIGWNVESIDLYPTILDFAGLPVPRQFMHKGKNHIYGQSLKGLIELDPETVSNWQEPVLSQIFIYSRAIRIGDWKLIWGLNKGDRVFRYNCDEFRLYDVRNDPAERENRALEFPDKVNELTGALEMMMSEVEGKRNFKQIPFDKYFKAEIDASPELVDTLIGLGYLTDATIKKMYSKGWEYDENQPGASSTDENCGCRGRDLVDQSIEPWQLPVEPNSGI